MTAEVVKISPFAAFYVGDFGASTQLTRITLLNTANNELHDETKTTWFNGLGLQLQTGPRVVSVPNLTFYNDDIMLYNLSQGLSVANTSKSTPPGNTNTQYALFILYPDDSEDSSIYIPKCRTERSYKTDYAKTKATDVAITFIVEDPNAYKDIVFYNTPDNLATIMGPTISPI